MNYILNVLYDFVSQDISVYFCRRIMKAAIGATTNNEAKKKIVLDKINSVIPDQKMQQLLKGILHCLKLKLVLCKSYIDVYYDVCINAFTSII